MRRIFVDTGWFVAERNQADAEHHVARTALAGLVRDRVSLFTSNYVFAETYTTLLGRVGRAAAIEWGEKFKGSIHIELFRIDPELEAAAWDLLRLRADKRWSYVDATSFALMEHEGVTAALAFDHHFAQAGFEMLPG